MRAGHGQSHRLSQDPDYSAVVELMLLRWSAGGEGTVLAVGESEPGLVAVSDSFGSVVGLDNYYCFHALLLQIS